MKKNRNKENKKLRREDKRVVMEAHGQSGPLELNNPRFVGGNHNFAINLAGNLRPECSTCFCFPDYFSCMCACVYIPGHGYM